MDPTPPTMMVYVFRHTWLLFMLVTSLNAASWWYKSRKKVIDTPELEPGYRKLILGMLIYGNIPWIVMGAGILFGGIPSTFHYFNPRNGAFVIAFYLSVVILWGLCVRWIFFKNGAEDLVTYSGLFRRPISDPRMIKLYVILMLAGGIVGLTMMLTGNIQAPLFVSV